MNRVGISISIILILAVASVSAQTYRTYTGWGNNLANPHWGAVGDALVDRNSPAFGDGYSTPAGQNRYNARLISNFLASQPQPINSQIGLSDFTWVFGQLIDHEFALVLDDGQQPFPVVVNFPDPQFNPGGALPAVTIGMHRSRTIPGTGTEPGNPRRFPNSISSFFDASMVYGSDSTWASWLRTHQDGKMKTSTGNLLPFNTINGEFEGDLDPTAPFMDNPLPFNKKLFVGGDIRTNENVFLTAIHTLFMREHNWQCDQIKARHPEWNDEQIYQHARKMVNGIITAITYEEWLPTIGVVVPPYTGYNPAQHPGLFNVFSAAAFRLGHTLLSSNLPRRDNLGRQVPQGDILLKDAFFNPVQVLNSGGVDPMLKGMAHQMQQDFDQRVISDVRNFLFGPPGAGGRDLVSINIQRGRERGLPDFNTIRQEFGLPKYNSFMEMLGDEDLAALFETAYGNINNIDAWIGFISEAKVPGTLFGSTLHAVMAEQFAVLRDGDRFYYENDADLSAEEKATIKATRLYDVLMRNSEITILQKNVFLMEAHETMCDADSMEASLQGIVLADQNGEPLSDVHLSLRIDYKSPLALDNEGDGTFDFGLQQTCRKYHLHAERPDTYLNGLSIADLVLLQKHLMGSTTLSTPYKFIAADVNNSGAVSVADLYDIRRLLLGKISVFEGSEPWVFVDNTYTFQNPSEPLVEWEDASLIKVSKLTDDHYFEVRGIKKGDLNGTAKLGLITSEVRYNDALEFQIVDRMVSAEQPFTVAFTSPNIQDFTGFQMTLSYPIDKVSFAGIVEEGLPMSEGLTYTHIPEKGLINILLDWEKPLEPGTIPFSIAFESKKRLNTRDAVRLTTQFLNKEAVTTTLDIADIELRFQNELTTGEVLSPFQVFGNQPNPFNTETVISFELPEGGDVELVVYDLNGRQLLRRTQNYHKGYNQLAIHQLDLSGASGILIYQLNCAHGTFSDRMIMTD